MQTRRDIQRSRKEVHVAKKKGGKKMGMKGCK
jgi:hypothetical protein